MRYLSLTVIALLLAGFAAAYEFGRVAPGTIFVVAPNGSGSSFTHGNPGSLSAANAAAKAGVMALTRCAALEAAEYGVRINAVSPSFATHPFLVKTTPKETLDKLEAQEAFGRGAQPFEVANVMVFLASDYSSYMTGETVAVSSQRA